MNLFCGIGVCSSLDRNTDRAAADRERERRSIDKDEKILRHVQRTRCGEKLILQSHLLW